MPETFHARFPVSAKKKTTVIRTWYTAADTEASCRTREKTSGTQDRSGLASTPVIYLVKWAQKIMGTEAPYNVQSNDNEFVTINNEPPPLPILNDPLPPSP